MRKIEDMHNDLATLLGTGASLHQCDAHDRLVEDVESLFRVRRLLLLAAGPGKEQPPDLWAQVDRELAYFKEGS